MSFLDEIKKQPQHIREIMFGLCVVTTISLVGMVWFGSFKNNLYVLLNPDQTIQQQLFASNSKVSNPSLFASISGSLKDLKATLLNVLNLNKGDTIRVDNNSNPVKAYLLPLSGEK